VTPLPGYWMNETSGALRPVVEKYLRGEQLEPYEIGLMRLYLRQWVGGAFHGPLVAQLRRDVHSIATNAEIRDWLGRALDAGIDPL
jgi:hypothetical protein